MFSNIKRFARTTSLKGVPRIINNEIKCLKAVWFCSVLVFFSLGIWQVSELLINYFSYSVTQSTRIGLIKFDDVLVSPRITLCNLSPTQSLPPEYIVSHSNRSNLYGKTLGEMYQEFITILKTNTKCHGNCSEEDEYLLDEIYRELSGLVGVNQLIGVDVAKKLGSQKETFIASCSAGFKKGEAYVYVPCYDTINVTELFSVSMGNCFSLDMPRVSPFSADDAQLSLSFILFLDNLFYDNHFFDEYTDLTTLGAYLELSSKNQKPLVSNHFITLPPGSHTTVRYRVHRWENIGPPYGTCKVESEETADQFGIHCMRKCITKGLQLLCGCTAFNYGVLLELNETYPYCGNATLPWYTLLEFYRCTRNNKPTLELENCTKRCYFPCRQYSFDMEKSSSLWPTFAAQDSFWKTMMNKPAIKAKLQPYMNYIQMSQNRTEHCYSVSGIKHVIIKENFLKVTIQLGSTFQTFVETIPKYTFASLLSSVGAALNFWSGITVVIIVEVFEMCYRVLVTDRNHEESKNRSKGWANKVGER